jgi:hypothetical protein
LAKASAGISSPTRRRPFNRNIFNSLFLDQDGPLNGDNPK